MARVKILDQFFTVKSRLVMERSDALKNLKIEKPDNISVQVTDSAKETP